jgi:transcriptional regulator of arginine metabolism
MTKQERHFKIKSLLARFEFSNQTDLLEKLRLEGVEVTQATLSRDCSEMGVIRMPSPEGYKLIIDYPKEVQGLRNLIGLEIMSVKANESMIVIKTLPGRASGVASFLDSFENSDIIGTLAGDDTVLVVPSSNATTSNVLTFIQQSISEN